MDSFEWKDGLDEIEAICTIRVQFPPFGFILCLGVNKCLTLCKNIILYISVFETLSPAPSSAEFGL